MDSKKQKIGPDGDQLNKYNEVCNNPSCKKKTIPFMGRTRICPDCETEKKEEEVDLFDFEMRDLTAEEEKEFRGDEEITIPIDLEKDQDSN